MDKKLLIQYLEKSNQIREIQQSLYEAKDEMSNIENEITDQFWKSQEPILLHVCVENEGKTFCFQFDEEDGSIVSVDQVFFIP